MFPILFSIGSFHIYTHGVMAVLGIILGSLTVYSLAKKKGYNTEYLFDYIIYVVLVGIIGARVTYFVLYHDQFSQLRQILYLSDGGMVSYGGFILGGLMLYLLFRSQKETVMKWLDLFALGFPFALILGRVGNLFAGEYAGVITKSRFSIDHQVPIPVYEGLFLIVILIILILLARKKKLVDGTLFFSILAMYGGFRFILDFWRDEPHLFSIISLGQIISLLVFVFGALNLLRINRKLSKKESAV